MEKIFTDLFIDFDDTIYDTHGNAQLALAELFDHFNLDHYFSNVQDFAIPYWQTNVELWDQYARGLIKRDYLMVERFRRPLAVGVDKDGNNFNPTEEYCLEVSDYFLERCSCKPGVVKDAHEIMQYLKDRGYRLHICSNGFREVQFKKLTVSRLMPFFEHIILSEDAGVNKPAREFFDFAINTTGANPQTTLMIGDNLSTDIQGAHDAGLKTMYFNRKGVENTTNEEIDFQIFALSDIKKYL